jgi:AcrR family transcriptional regulator
MTARQPPRIASRKHPQQARSTELVAAILQAAIQVLAKEGATRFTTARVAEKAGVSVGSVYQYFPNKAAILFRLQSDEWQQTTQMLCAILERTDSAPLDRLRTVAFVGRRRHPARGKPAHYKVLQAIGHRRLPGRPGTYPFKAFT